jgi:hypothetical protein
MLIAGKLTAAKARKMLHDRSWKTEKQRRYFGWVAGGRKRRYDGDDIQLELHRDVIGLLNKRTRQDSQRALEVLEWMYLDPDEWRVGLEFSSCSEKPPSKMYAPFRTGYANAKRIHICSDTMTDEFNATLSKQINYDPARVSHYAAVFLHEFAHVMDKREIPGDYGGKSHVERRADAWAQGFIDLAGWSPAL